ncbi:MAG: hypothetical protein OEZ54_12660, partial [Gemmatimonadota bacterium]|nr:hypothetical protein [Gemmatimonadota bacterium]
SGSMEGWVATVDTVGDTIVVRTESGSVWGDTAILVEEMRIGVFEGPDEYMLGRVVSMAVTSDDNLVLMDRHVPALRVYDASGSHVVTMGREGGGPGEYENPDGGLGVLSDGRIVLRDPGNARFSVYSGEGEYLSSWPISGGFNTSRKMVVATGDTVLTMVLLEAGLAPWDWTYGLARYSSDGAVVDTLKAPTWDYEPPQIRGEREGSSSTNGVPFGADDIWTFSPLGYFVGGVATDYRIDLYRPDAPTLRIERNWTPVGVLPEEKEERERSVTENFRRQFPGWRWNGPPIPDTKPAFSDIHVGDDGRIWIVVPTEAAPVMSVEEAREAEEDAGRPVLRYKERLAFDVFEPDGTFLGHVIAPSEVQTYPRPVFKGDYVWAAVEDDLGVISIVRFKITLTPAA